MKPAFACQLLLLVCCVSWWHVVGGKNRPKPAGGGGRVVIVNRGGGGGRVVIVNRGRGGRGGKKGKAKNIVLPSIGGCQCSSYGDPHFSTFDKRTFDFQGSCKYVLAQSQGGGECNFMIAGSNSFGVAVTTTESIEINILGNRINLGQGRSLSVNGQGANSVDQPGRIVVARSGNRIVFVSTQCGVQVTWDGMDAIITLDRGRWAGRVQGMCGNCNGNQGDDFKDRNGRIVDNSAEFGNSWLIGDHRGRGNCRRPVPARPQHQPRSPAFDGNGKGRVRRPGPPQPPPPPPPAQCRAPYPDLVPRMDWCGALQNRNGPFAACMNRPGVLNWPARFTSCRFDVCSIGSGGNRPGAKRAACEILASAVFACARAGFAGIKWRAPTSCQLACPANEYYEGNLEPCPTSCSILRNGVPPACATLPRSEGCRCRPGLVRMGAQCVAPQNCPAKPKIVIKEPPPRPLPSITGCVCGAWGDPHYTTFDRVNYDYMGSCVYVMARSRGGRGCAYEVSVVNTEVVPTWTESVEVKMFGSTFSMRRGNILFVNGKQVHTVYDGTRVEIIRSGTQMVFASKMCGIMVTWDGSHVIQVIVEKARWGGRVQGLCGNCNGNQADEFQDPNGLIQPSPQAFGNSWLLRDQRGKNQCRVPEPRRPLPPPTCPGDWEGTVAKPDWCGALRNAGGPFGACMAKAGLNNWPARFSGCRFDVCSIGKTGDRPRAKSAACEVLNSAAMNCARGGFAGIQWRAATNCALPCPADQVYAANIEPCPTNCAILRDGVPPVCATMPRTEGCRCRPGLVRFGVGCVAPQNCPLKQDVTLPTKLPPVTERPVSELSPLEMQLINKGEVPDLNGLTQQCVR